MDQEKLLITVGLSFTAVDRLDACPLHQSGRGANPFSRKGSQTNLFKSERESVDSVLKSPN